MPARKYDFFIAHAGSDKVLAQRLYEMLVPHARVYLDTECLKLGDDWDRELASAQRESIVTLVLVSSKADDAYYEREEIAAALAMAREDKNSHRVVPLFVDSGAGESTHVPYGLRLKHGLSVAREDDLELTAKRLLELLEQLHPPTAEDKEALNALSPATTTEELERRLADVARQAKDTDGSVSVIFLDLDGFTGINRNYGKVVGNKVIEIVHGIIATAAGDDACMRWAADEFVVLLKDTDQIEAHKVALGLNDSIVRYPWRAVAPELFVGGSFGVADLRANEDAAVWLIRAIHGSREAKRIPADDEKDAKVRQAPLSLLKNVTRCLDDYLSP